MKFVVRQNRKSIAISIDEHLQVLVKAPLYVSQKEIDEVVKSYQPWIEKAIQAKKERLQAKDWLTKGEILFLGEYKKIVIEKPKRDKDRVTYVGNQLIVETDRGDNQEHIRGLVENYMRKQALSILTEVSHKYCQLIECNYKKITIRKQKTRWGSCSNKGHLSYNVKIMCAPMEAIEYIVLHEVMHLRHFNHGEQFWNDIAKVMPNYNEHRNYFKTQGKYLEI